MTVYRGVRGPPWHPFPYIYGSSKLGWMDELHSLFFISTQFISMLGCKLPICTREFCFQLKSYVKSWISSLTLVYLKRKNDFRNLFENNSVTVWFIVCSVIYEQIWTWIPTLYEVCDTSSARYHTAKESSSVSSSDSSSKNDAGTLCF